MAKKKKDDGSILSEEQEKKLENMVNDMLDIASNVFKEYEDLDLSELGELSGSITQIHEDSPFLDEIFKGDSWKKVIKTDGLSKPTTKKEDKDDKK